MDLKEKFQEIDNMSNEDLFYEILNEHSGYITNDEKDKLCNYRIDVFRARLKTVGFLSEDS